MSIGETLVRARHEAGLSVADVSRQTRIRETIISGIERDDFSQCGGDFYARGHIRAIARAAGIDSRPLIDEYDAVHLAPGVIPSGHRPPLAITEDEAEAEANEPVTPVNPVTPVSPRPPVTPRQPPAPGDSTGRSSRPGPLDAWFLPDAPEDHATPEDQAMPDETASPGPPATPGPPASPGPPAAPSSTSTGPSTPGEPPAHGTPPGAHARPGAGGEGGPSTFDRHRMNWSIILGLALLVVLALGGYRLASAGHSPAARSAAAAHGATSHPSARPTPAASPATSAPATPSPPPVQALTPASISAFGPDGAGQGDNPQLAQYALEDNAATPWHSDWYTTPQFGNLEPGTGLLLDMGRNVTVTAAQVAVGDVTGGDIQLRVGSTPALSGLPPVAHSSDAGGTVRLHLTAPSQGRYVLVWFTKLPADQAGTFQASVYSIKLQGTA